MKTLVTYWREPDGRYLGFLRTQGDTLDDLKEHLRDLFLIFGAEDIPGIRREEELEIV